MAWGATLAVLAQLPAPLRADERAGKPAGNAKQVAASDGSSAAAGANAGVLGYWKRVDDDTGRTLGIFKLWKHDGKIAGRIVKLFPEPGKAPQERCTECSGRRRDKPVVGMTFLWGFTPDEDDARKWVDGTILNPEDGKTYDCEMELSKDGKTLDVFGYVQVLIKIGGTSTWQRPTTRELAGI